MPPSSPTLPGGSPLRRPKPSSWTLRLPTLLLATGLLFSTACRPRISPVEAGIREGRLHYAISAEPRDLDPQVLVSFNDMKIILALFEGLTALDELTSQPIPAAAASWEVSADQLTWTFHLHPGQRWSDGTPLSAHDFVFSFRRALSPRLGAEYAYVLHPIVGAQAYNDATTNDFSTVGVNARDDLTLELRLHHPHAVLPAILALPVAFPVPPHVITAGGRTADDRANPWTRPGTLVGNGPFALTAWVPNQRVAVERNPHHRLPVAPGAIRSVVFHPFDNAAAQEAAFRAGQLHLTSEVPLSRLDTYRERHPEKLRLDPFLETGFLRFNVTRPPLDDPRVRRALALSIDREIIARRVLGGGQQPAPRFTPPDTAGYTATATQAHDPAAARALLAAAGYPEGRGLRSLELMTFGSEVNRRVVEALQQMWSRELGLTVSLLTKEQRVWLDDERQLNYDLSLGRWIGDYVDPGTFLDLFTAASGNNATGWSDPAYDALIAAASGETDATRRHALYQEAEALLLAAAPIAPVYHGTQAFLIHPALQGWHESLLGFNRYHALQLVP
jgi:oligopeptide transport system substrate-binding protein